MNAYLIARREVVQWKFVFLAAIANALVPFIAAVTHAAVVYGRETVIVDVAGVLGIAFVAGLALILGTALIATDSANRQLGFLLSRPLTPAAIWIGKLAAALLLISFSFAVITVPASLIAPNRFHATWDTPNLPFAEPVLICGLILLLLSGAVTTMVRSRSALVFLDVLFAVAAGYAFSRLTGLVFTAGSFDVSRFFGITVGMLLILILTVAGWWQLSRGRVNRRAQHIHLSRFLWSSVAGVLLLVGALLLWVRSATPDDLVAPLYVTRRSRSLDQG